MIIKFLFRRQQSGVAVQFSKPPHSKKNLTDSNYESAKSFSGAGRGI